MHTIASKIQAETTQNDKRCSGRSFAQAMKCARIEIQNDVVIISLREKLSILSVYKNSQVAAVFHFMACKNLRNEHAQLRLDGYQITIGN